MKAIMPFTARLAWQVLEAHYPKILGLYLRKLFADNLKRGGGKTDRQRSAGAVYVTCRRQ
jgi:hypothetical protein